MFLAALQRRLTARPRRAAFFRYAGVLGTVTAVTWILPFVGITGPAAAAVTLGAVIVCAWYGGLGPAVLLPPLLFVMANLKAGKPLSEWRLASNEVLAVLIITIITAAVGLAGQFRRRIRAVTREHSRKLRDQARALSLAHIVFTDVDGTIVEWNEGAESMYGWTSAEALGRPLHDLLQTRFLTSREEIYDVLLQTGQWEGELVHSRKDGTELIVAAHRILYRDEHDRPIGIAQVHNDVSEQRRAEAAIRESDRRKDEFLAMLGHELRNPLAPIRSGLDILALDDRADRETIGLVQDQVQHLVRLVDDLLDVSRIMRGKVELRQQPVELSDVLKRSIEAVRPQVDAHRREFVVSLPQQPIWLNADSVRLAQVFGNLLINAFKYTEQDGRIELAGERRNGHAIISIRDTGIGIEPELLPRVFDLFTQSSRSLDRSQGGLGIGLTLVQRLVELHGGTITADSPGLGRGSSFVVQLPVTEAARERSPAAAPRVAGCGRNILVVDDNVSAARMLSILLKKLGDHQVETVHDGPSALDKLQHFHPDVVLLDIGLPGMDGYDVARCIRKIPQWEKLMLVAVTGYGQADDRRKSRDAGFDVHLVKPVETSQLTQLIDELQATPQ